MRLTGKHRITTGKQRMAVAAAGAVAAVALTQIVPSAFGSGNSGTKAAAPADASSDHVDAGISATDGTVFRGGVMTLGAAPAHPRAAAVAAAKGPAQGPGWQVSDGVTKSLSTGYTLKFYDRQAVNWLAPYVKRTATELARSTGLPISVDTTPVGWDHARLKGEIIMGVLKRPCVPNPDSPSKGWKIVRDGSGTANLSCGFASSSVPDTVTSGHAYIDSEFFTSAGKPAPSWGGETFMRNHISHEIGHTMGLVHAVRSAARGDCVQGQDSGEKPVMCTNTVPGYNDSRAGEYVQQFDVQGLRYLAANAGAAVPPQGRVTGLGGKCLDVKGAKAANGTQIQIYKCNGTAAQSWILEKNGEIRALGKCLDADGSKVDLRDCDGKSTQRWSVNAKKQIVSAASHKVLDVTGGKTADGTKVQLYPANTNKRQLWTAPK